VLGQIQSLVDGLVVGGVGVGGQGQGEQLHQGRLGIFRGILGDHVEVVDAHLVHGCLCVAAQGGDVDFRPFRVMVGVLVQVQGVSGDVIGAEGGGHLIVG